MRDIVASAVCRRAETTSAQRSSSVGRGRVVAGLGPHVGDRLGRVGQHQRPAARCPRRTRTPSVVSSGRSPGLLDHRAHDDALGRPRGRDRPAAHVAAAGSGRRSRTACSWVRATSPTSCTKAAMPSYVVENSGTTNPPRPSPPKIDPVGRRPPRSARPARWRSTRCRRRGRRPPARRPGSSSPAAPPCRRRRSAATRSSTTSSARSSSMIEPLLVDQGDPLADRVEVHAERGPGRGHQLGRAGAAPRRARPRVSVGRRLVQAVVDGEDVQAEPAEQGRQHQRGGAAAGVDHDLQAVLSGRPDMSTVRSSSRV